MYEILTQKLGKLEIIQEDEKIKQIKTYQRGVYKFNLEERPKCNVCGSDLQFIKKGKYLIINKCLNDNCPTNHCEKKGNPIKWKAFLPKDILEQHNKNYKENNPFDINYLINKKGYTEEKAIQYINGQKEQRRLNGSKNKGISKKEQYIKKYGEELGIKKMYEDHPLHIEHWIKQGYSNEEAKNKISEIQKNNSKKVKKYGILTKSYLKSKNIDPDKFMKERSIRCIEYYLKRGYSKEEGEKIIRKIQSNYASRVKNHRSNRQIQYWLDKGYSEQDAKEIISKLQNTFSKEKCIEKYGEIEGLKVFKERQQKWQKTLHDNHTIKCGYSKVSQELFKILLRYYNKNDRINILYATKNREFCINDNSVNYLYDFTDLKNKKIIEFQGDLYHANPKLYTNENYINPYDPNKTAEFIWNKDLNKKQIAEKYGFNVEYVWEYDYRINKEEIINKCKHFLGIDG